MRVHREKLICVQLAKNSATFYEVRLFINSLVSIAGQINAAYSVTTYFIFILILSFHQLQCLASSLLCSSFTTKNLPVFLISPKATHYMSNPSDVPWRHYILWRYVV
jgi:hypothetical protein